MRPLREALDGDPPCELLLEWVDGCREIDREIYRDLLHCDEPQSVDEIADSIDRDRSTAYRAVRRLHEKGYLEREQVTYDNGGYCYRFVPTDPEEVAQAIRERLEQYHRDLDNLVEEFRREYGAVDQKSGRSSGAS